MIKREKIELVKKQKMIAGIDIGEERHCVQFIDNYGETKGKAKKISNDREGFKRIEEMINSFSGVDHNILFSMEPSGDYWKPLAYYLKSKGYKVVIVNPFHTKQMKELLDNTQSKNDIKDAYLIADLCKQSKFFQPTLSEGVYAELRELNLAWRRTNKSLMQSKNYVNNFLSKYFPEYKRCFSDIYGKSSIYCLEHFPLPEDIRRLGLKRLKRILKRVSRGKYKREKIERLYERAKESIGIKEGRKTAKKHLKEIIKDIKVLKERKERIKGEMGNYLEKTGYKEYLLSIPGVGVTIGSLFLGEVGEISKYRNSCQIEKLAGLNLVENSSGKRESGLEISRRGRDLLRYAGYMAATNGIAKNPEIKELYRYKMKWIKNPKENKMKVITSIAAKMLRIMFSVCKNKQYYKREEITKRWQKGEYRGRVRPVNLHKAIYENRQTL